jgi:ElaB/YqjD/DUF883 family membrane-anchored ribosome-binding protein
MRQKVSATAEAARRRLADLVPDVADAASGALEGTVAFARANPWRAAALTALAYIAISTFWRGSNE